MEKENGDPKAAAFHRCGELVGVRESVATDTCRGSDHWWVRYGHRYPHVRSLALRLLPTSIDPSHGILHFWIVLQVEPDLCLHDFDAQERMTLSDHVDSDDRERIVECRHAAVLGRNCVELLYQGVGRS